MPTTSTLFFVQRCFVIPLLSFPSPFPSDHPIFCTILYAMSCARAQSERVRKENKRRGRAESRNNRLAHIAVDALELFAVVVLRQSGLCCEPAGRHFYLVHVPI